MKSSHGTSQKAVGAIAIVTVLLFNSHAAFGGREQPPAEQAQRVAIQIDVNGLFVGVETDGTLSPRSTTIGLAEQFEVRAVGNGLIALKSVLNERYVRTGSPLAARSSSIGPQEILRQVGGGEGLLRLRTAGAGTFVCAADAGNGLLVATRGCPHEWQVMRLIPVETPRFTITSPPPQSTFRTTSVTFRWEPGGDEYWLNVGTTPGGSDLYESGSLDTATEQTVSGLPLNGAPLYAQLRRRQGALVQSVTVQYTAAVRKGLLVITDFTNRRLEDWTGDGMRTVEDASAQVRKMEDHWAWLSRGLEKMRWDITRVQLDKAAVPDAYPSWVAFRDAAIALARQTVDPADYDVNADGDMDVSWLVVSSGDDPVGDWAIGGASGADGSCVFVDGQASLSVKRGATGNFTHETGHCLGLMDMYGPYDTLHTLTDMSYSWDVPPPDFAAYDRLKLGWLKPRTIAATTRNVSLPTASDVIAGVRIPTTRADEYFLIEYRRRPSSGFGSVNPDFNGLAVYHVMEGSSMWQDPPIVKLEPADGTIAPGAAIDINDFVSPENPFQQHPMVLTSYFGDDEVFRIDNVRWGEGSILFDLAIATQSPSPDLLKNGSFETGQSDTPDWWWKNSYTSAPSGFLWPSPIARDGTASAQLVSTDNDMQWNQTVNDLVPGGHYRLCGFLKGENVAVAGGTGGNVSVFGGWVSSEALSGTFDWTERCVNFTADAAQVTVSCRIGFWSSISSGTLWCDTFSLAKMRSAFE